jgi:hypothetical protein
LNFFDFFEFFVLVYSPTGSGTVDTAGITSVQNAAITNIGTEVYVAPQPSGSKQGYQQFDETYNAFKNRGLILKTIWLQVRKMNKKNFY